MKRGSLFSWVYTSYSNVTLKGTQHKLAVAIMIYVKISMPSDLVIQTKCTFMSF